MKHPQILSVIPEPARCSASARKRVLLLGTRLPKLYGGQVHDFDDLKPGFRLKITAGMTNCESIKGER